MSHKHNKLHHTSTDSHDPSTNLNSSFHLHKLKCKSHNTNDQLNEITGQTCASKNTKSKPEDIKDPLTLTATLTPHQTQNDHHKLMKLLRSN